MDKYSIKHIGLLALISICFATFNLHGQDVRFYAEASQNEVAPGEFFDVTFYIENASGDDFTPPSFAGFNIAAGPNKASSTTIINGRISKKASYTFTLEPIRKGKFTISPAFVVIQGKKLATKPIPIDVTDTPSGTRSDISASRAAEEVFVQAELSHKKAYPGQQITLEYVVYTRTRVISANFKSLPKLTGVFTKDFRNYNAGERQKTVNGKNYVTKTIKKIALYPQQTGTIEIEPAAISLGIPFEDDGFGGLLGGSSRPKLVQSNSLTLEVLPLPIPTPAGFSGAVGQFEYEVSADRTAMTTDEAAMLNFKIKGNGDIKMVQPPQIKNDSTFDAYTPELLDDAEEETRQGFVSTRNYIVDLTPKVAGQQTLDLPAFTYFDIESNNYKTISPDPITFDIQQGVGIKVNETPTVTKTKDVAVPSFFDIYRTPIIAIGTSLVLLSLVGLILRRSKKQEVIEQPEQDTSVNPQVVNPEKEQLIQQRQLNQLTNHISDIKHLLMQGQVREAYKQMNETANLYFSQKLDLPMSTYSVQAVVDKLKMIQKDEATITSVESTLRQLERAAYAGLINPAKTDELLANIEHWITQDI